MIKDGQVRQLFRLLDTGTTLAAAARKTDMNETTARKYRKARKLPSELVSPLWWRTRTDPFEKAWPLVEELLRKDSDLKAVTLFSWLQEHPKYKGQFPDSQRRTFERRVRHWRATRGPGQAVID